MWCEASGGVGPWPWLVCEASNADATAAVAAFVAAFAAVSALLVAYRSRYYDDAERAVRALTSSEMAAARNVIGRAARAQSIRRRDVDEVRSAIFFVLWELQRASLIKRRVAPVINDELVLLYGHMDLIIADLNRVLTAHPDVADASTSIALTNGALGGLKDIKRPWWGRVREAPGLVSAS